MGADECGRKLAAKRLKERVEESLAMMSASASAQGPLTLADIIASIAHPPPMPPKIVVIPRGWWRTIYGGDILVTAFETNPLHDAVPSGVVYVAEDHRIWGGVELVYYVREADVERMKGIEPSTSTLAR